MSKIIKVSVPGTTANCGPGFDAVGIACTIYNELELTLLNGTGLEIDVQGEGEAVIPRDESNIVLQAVQTVLAGAGKACDGVRLKMINRIPLARGLGSSAAAIVAGLVAANQAVGAPLGKDELLQLATKLEGHPDNVAPALYGGVTASISTRDKARCLSFLPPAPLRMVVAVPAFNLSTKLARQALPERVELSDAVFNVGRTAYLMTALCRGEFSHLQDALEDKLHQPYRRGLIPGMDEVMHAALGAGALGAALSGAGPCMIAFADHNEAAIGRAMADAFRECGVEARFLLLDIDTQGARVLE